MHAAVTGKEKRNSKIKNSEAKENLLNKMQHASYSNRYRQAYEKSDHHIITHLSKSGDSRAKT